MKKVMIALLVLTVVTVEVYAQQNTGDFLDLRSVASHDSDLRFNNPLWSPDGKFIALSDENYNGVYIYNTIENTYLYLEITDAPSSGYSYNWSYDSGKLGFKLLIPTKEDEFPLQMPVVFHLDKQELAGELAPGDKSHMHQAKIAGRGLRPRPKPLLAGIDGTLRTGLQTPSGRSCMNKNSWL